MEKLWQPCTTSPLNGRGHMTEDAKKAYAKRQYFRKYYNDNKERIVERDRLRHNNNPEIREKRKKEWKENNPERYILTRIRESAKKRDLEFNLTVEDIIIPKFCKYLGIEITVKCGVGLKPSAASVDRIDSSKGYVRGNIQIISNKANAMKRDATIEDLIIFAKSVLKIHGDN